MCTVTAARRSACAVLLRLAIGSDWQNDAVRRSGIEVLIKIGRCPSRGRWQDHFFPIAWRSRSHRCCRQALIRRWIQHRIARREIESSQCLGQHRWVVERTLAQFAQLRLLQPLRATGYRFRLLKPGRRLRCLALHRTIVSLVARKSDAKLIEVRLGFGWGRPFSRSGFWFSREHREGLAASLRSGLSCVWQALGFVGGYRVLDHIN